jgi:hypothetical protein
MAQVELRRCAKCGIRKLSIEFSEKSKVCQSCLRYWAKQLTTDLLVMLPQWWDPETGGFSRRDL